MALDSTPVARKPRYRFGDAARALNALFANPDDTAQVFRIIDALSGPSAARALARLRRSSAGRRLLRDRPRLLDRLTDHDALRKLPAGSLGREYLRFLESEGITAEGLRRASQEGRLFDDVPADLAFLRDRMRDAHDLWHTVTGYKGDLVGEASLLAFSFAQTRNPGVGFIVAMVLVRAREPGVRRLVLDGFARGARAISLIDVEWENLLALPLSQVRRKLRIADPPDYVPIRTTDLPRAKAA
jgi:ubiquinone biosynthesis protein COQ4